MLYAFDLDGTLSAHAAVLGPVAAALRAAGHRTVVLTATGDLASRRAQIAALGLADAFDDVAVLPGPTIAECAAQKGDWCRANGAALMVEDRPDYAAACAAGGALALLIVPPSP